MSDSITVLTAHGRRMCKTISPDTVRDYDSAYRFDIESRDLADLDDLLGLLLALAARPECCVVRGAIADPYRTRRVRRLLHEKPGDNATLRAVPRRWIALDLDGLPLPAGTDPSDLGVCAAAVLPMLPVAFTGCAGVVQATATHAIKPGARLRLWYWLDRALSTVECKSWFRGFAVDISIFAPAQPIYTAAPIFTDMSDPLPHRLHRLAGRPMVPTPSPAALAPSRRPAPAGVPVATAAGASRYALAALTRAAARVASAGIGGRHPAALAGAWGLAPLVRAGLLSEGEVKRALGDAIQHVGKDRSEADEIVAWALANRPETGGPRA